MTTPATFVDFDVESTDGGESQSLTSDEWEEGDLLNCKRSWFELSEDKDEELATVPFVSGPPGIFATELEELATVPFVSGPPGVFGAEFDVVSAHEFLASPWESSPSGSAAFRSDFMAPQRAGEFAAAQLNGFASPMLVLCSGPPGIFNSSTLPESSLLCDGTASWHPVQTEVQGASPATASCVSCGGVSESASDSFCVHCGLPRPGADTTVQAWSR